MKAIDLQQMIKIHLIYEIGYYLKDSNVMVDVKNHEPFIYFIKPISKLIFLQNCSFRILPDLRFVYNKFN